MGLVRPCWAGLSAAERAAAAALGWSGAEAWDGGGMPAAAELLWAELAQAQRDAATALGFSGPGWDGEEEAAPSADQRVQAMWDCAPDTPPRVACSAVHPKWRDSSRERPWFIHFWEDGSFWKQDPRRKSNLTATLHGLPGFNLTPSGRWSWARGAGGACRLTLHWGSDSGGRTWGEEVFDSYDGGASYSGDAGPGRHCHFDRK